MSQAEELLNSVASLYAIDPTIESHIVIGSDRFITVPEELKRIAVQHDHAIETVTFDCPRYWDNHDMSKMKIYVNYLRMDEEKGSDLCTNVVIDKNDDNIMHFDWTITGHLSAVPGPIVFLVCIQKMAADGTSENHWNSELNTDLYVSEGLEVEPHVTAVYPGIITTLLTRMDIVEDKTTDEALVGYVNTFVTNNPSKIVAAVKPTVESHMTTNAQGYVDDYMMSTDGIRAVTSGVSKHLTDSPESLSYAVDIHMNNNGQGYVDDYMSTEGVETVTSYLKNNAMEYVSNFWDKHSNYLIDSVQIKDVSHAYKTFDSTYEPHVGESFVNESAFQSSPYNHLHIITPGRGQNVSCPYLDTSHINQIIVIKDGIIVDVIGARFVSMFNSIDSGYSDGYTFCFDIRTFNTPAEGNSDIVVCEVRQHVNFVKIAEIESTISDDLSNLEKNKADVIINSAEGSSIVINDGSDSVFKSFAIDGKSEQKQYIGKNFLNTSGLTQKIDGGITFTPVYDDDGFLKYINVKGTSSKNNVFFDILSMPVGTWILSGGKDKVVVKAIVNNSSTDATNSKDGNEVKVTVPGNVDKNWLRLTIPTSGTVVDTEIYPMLRPVDTDATYEPYTGSTASSKNLFEHNMSSYEANGVTFTVNDDKSIKLVGKPIVSWEERIGTFNAKGGVSYILSGCPAGGDTFTYHLFLSPEGVTSSYDIVDYGNGDTFKPTTDTTYNVYLSIGTYDNNTFTGEVFAPMIRIASETDDTYQPYGYHVNLKPSPHLDCQQNIENAGNYVESVNKYGIETKSTGKNLLNTKGLVPKSVNGITFTPIYDINGLLEYINVDGTASVDTYYHIDMNNPIPSFDPLIASMDGASDFCVLCIAGFIEGTTTFEDIMWIKGKEMSFDYKDMRATRTVLRIPKGSILNNQKVYPMIRPASITDSAYEPYKENKQTVYLTEPLRNGDVLKVFSDGTGEILRKRGVATLDQDLDWNIYTNSETDARYFYANIVRDDSIVENQIMCTHFKQNTIDSSTTTDGIDIYDISGSVKAIRINVRPENVTTWTLPQWKEFLANNTVIIEYELTTPIIEPLTSAQVDALLTLQTFKPITTITNDCGANMAVEYAADIKTYIDNKFAELAAAMM